MEDSPFGLDKWMTAIWMLANCKNGISSYELARTWAFARTRHGLCFTESVKLWGGERDAQKWICRTRWRADEAFIGPKPQRCTKTARRRATARVTACKGGYVARLPFMGFWTGRAARFARRSCRTSSREDLAELDPGQVTPFAKVYTEAGVYDYLKKKFVQKVIDHSRVCARSGPYSRASRTSGPCSKGRCGAPMKPLNHST